MEWWELAAGTSGGVVVAALVVRLIKQFLDASQDSQELSIGLMKETLINLQNQINGYQEELRVIKDESTRLISRVGELENEVKLLEGQMKFKDKEIERLRTRLKSIE